MKSFFQKIVVKITFFLSSFICFLVQLIPWNSQAKFSATQIGSFEKTQLANHEIMTNNCGNLLNLEGKENISESEFEQGILIHSLIQQISSNPLEYCDEILMAESFDEIETEDRPQMH